MRCTEVKRRMSEGSDWLDKEMLKHISACPSCAREAEAERALKRVLDGSKGAISIAELSAVRSRVDAKLAKQTTWERIMSRVKDQSNTQPAVITGLGLALAAFLLITLIPFSYTTTTGFNATITGVGPEFQGSTKLLAVALSAIGYEGVSISSDASFSQYTIHNLPSRSEAEDVAAAFLTVAGLGAEFERDLGGPPGGNDVPVFQSGGRPVRVEVSPVVEVVSAPLYAQIVEKIDSDDQQPVKIRFEGGELIINGKELKSFVGSTLQSDGEIKNTIENLLAESGLSTDEIAVTVYTNPDQKRRTVSLVQPGIDCTPKCDIAVHLDCCGREVYASFDHEEPEDSGDSVLQVEFNGDTVTGRTILITVKLADEKD